MPRYRTEVAHGLGQAEALARLKALTEKARGFSDLEGAWSENTFEFSVTAQGIGLKGKLRVEADALEFDGRLPLIAMPFKSWIGRVLKKSLEQQAAQTRVPQSESFETPEAPALSVTADAGVEALADDAAPTVLFLHIPKAGGQTLGEFVYNQCRAAEKREGDILDAGVAYLTYGFVKEPGLVVPPHALPLLRRTDLRAVIGHFWFGLHEHVRRPSTYITILRDPVERFVSLFYYLKLRETMSIEEFAARPPLKEADNDQTRRLAGVDPEVGACTREHLRAAQENLRRHFSVVGTTERFDETLVLLKRRLGWGREILSYPRNVNAERPATQTLSPQTLDAVRERNALDIELWQYATRLLDDAIAAEGPGFAEDLESYEALKSQAAVAPSNT